MGNKPPTEAEIRREKVIQHMIDNKTKIYPVTEFNYGCPDCDSYMMMPLYDSYRRFRTAYLYNLNFVCIEYVDDLLKRRWESTKYHTPCKGCVGKYGKDLRARWNFAKKLKDHKNIFDPDLAERVQYVREKYSMKLLI